MIGPVKYDKRFAFTGDRRLSQQAAGIMVERK
jgi:hypothetical protein